MDHDLELFIPILEILEIEVFIFPIILEILEISIFQFSTILEILEISVFQLSWYPGSIADLFLRAGGAPQRDGGGDGDVPTTLPSGQTPGPSRPGTKYPVRGQSLTSIKMDKLYTFVLHVNIYQLVLYMHMTCKCIQV